ncbi:MAG TPA: hypothetical protein DER60_10525 [Syntrophomonas sp.]|jgi:hypothetical protein|nr:hypothetical protein [Syntrophomonas sp.]
MRNFFEKVERSLIRVIVIALVALVVVQGVMTNDQARFYLSWSERMEGQALNLEEEELAAAPGDASQVAVSPQALLTLGIKDFNSLPKAKVLVNGKEYGFFNGAQVELKVNPQDVVEIDSTAYNFPVEYQVISRSPNLAYPRQGQAYTANQSMVMVGKIIVK